MEEAANQDEDPNDYIERAPSPSGRREGWLKKRVS